MVTSELRHEYGRPHVGGLVVVGSLFLCRAPFLDYIGCSTNFYDPAQRFSVKHVGFKRRPFREIGRIREPLSRIHMSIEIDGAR